MKTTLKTSILMAIGILSAESAFAVTLIKNFELNGSFADSLGGPAMVPGGGTLGPTGYTFDAGEGTSVAVLSGFSDYTIEMLFQLDDTSGYRKLIDFKDLTDDRGFYNLGTALNFYDYETGSAGAITDGTDVSVVLTRDSATKTVAGYVNGVPQWSFTDLDDAGIFDFGIAYFLIDDDTTSGGEASAGFLDRVRIYEGAATADQVAQGLSVPDGGSTIALLGLVMGGLSMARRKIGLA